MIVDTSALVTVLRDEEGASELIDLILTSSTASMSAASYVELGVVIDRAGDPVLSREVDALLLDLAITIAPVTAEHARLAREVYRDFGRGTGHPARLNFGDCFPYALHLAVDEPLLFVGEDFRLAGARSAR